MPQRAQARTRLARAAVVEAARTLFLAHGYGATTIDAISASAGVPVASVYRLFSSKLGILKSLLDVSIAGDDAPIPLADRPAVRARLDHPDPAHRVAGFASIVSEVNARIAPLYRILVSASDSDPGAAALLDDVTRQRQEGQRALVRSLASSGALGAGLNQRRAADLVHALASPEVYKLLVIDRSWTTDRYERWLASTLAAQLLAPIADLRT